LNPLLCAPEGAIQQGREVRGQKMVGLEDEKVRRLEAQKLIRDALGDISDECSG